MDHSNNNDTTTGARQTSELSTGPSSLLGPNPEKSRAAIKLIIEGIYEFTKHEAPELRLCAALISGGVWSSEMELTPEDLSLVQARSSMNELVERLVMHMRVNQPDQARAMRGTCATAARKGTTVLSLAASAAERSSEFSSVVRVAPEILKAARTLLNEMVQPLVEGIVPWSRRKQNSGRGLSPEEKALNHLDLAQKSAEQSNCLLPGCAEAIGDLRRKAYATWKSFKSRSSVLSIGGAALPEGDAAEASNAGMGK